MMKCDVAVIGGGPAGSTVGSLLKHYKPDLDIMILEREKFPREHVGESLLPTACKIMHELGAWEKMEAAHFPVKIGATYRWGSTPELIDFTFLPGEQFADIKRPSPYAGQRAATAFQVDRSVFDKILLDHAAELGCRVYEEKRVLRAEVLGDRVSSLLLDDGLLEATYYVDASGVSSVLRRAFDISIESPTALKNIAIWDYWQGAQWAKKVGQDGTHIQIMSIGWGWLWFITIGATRTSVGLVTPADYYKKSGLSREAIYLKAIAEEPNISKLLENGVRENLLQADRDWSFISDRLFGENWFLAGDSCGFADPILSAGITLAMTGARKVAYSILEMETGEADRNWVCEEYERTQKLNIQNHIRFADYWYSANAKFTDLQEYCTEIARDAGLKLDANDAFRWIGTGGFTDDIVTDIPYTGGYRLSEVKQAIEKFGGESPEWEVAKYNWLKLNLEGATRLKSAIYRSGRIQQIESYRRGVNTLVIDGLFKYALMALSQESVATKVVEQMKKSARRRSVLSEKDLFVVILEVLEAMLVEGWIEASNVELVAV